MTKPEAFGQNTQRFPETILALVLVLPAFFGGTSLTEHLQERACPWDAFLTGGLYLNAEMIFGIAAVATWWAVARHILLHRFEMLRRWLKVDLTCDQIWHERWGSIAAMAFTVAIIGFLTVIRAQYCLTLYDIKHRPLFSSTMVSHSWDNLSQIEVECHRGSKGSTIWSYDLVMRDGLKLDISASNEGFDFGYFYLKQVLSGVAYKFDTSRIRRDCPLGLGDSIRQKP